MTGAMALILEQYGSPPLPPTYRWRSVKCVFHDDRNASASYMSADEEGNEHQAFNCASCSTHGNPITLIAAVENIPRHEAADRVAEITGRRTERAAGGRGAEASARLQPRRIGTEAAGAGAAASPAPKPKRRIKQIRRLG